MKKFTQSLIDFLSSERSAASRGLTRFLAPLQLRNLHLLSETMKWGWRLLRTESGEIFSFCFSQTITWFTFKTLKSITDFYFQWKWIPKRNNELVSVKPRDELNQESKKPEKDADELKLSRRRRSGGRGGAVSCKRGGERVKSVAGGEPVSSCVTPNSERKRKQSGVEEAAGDLTLLQVL